MVIDGTGIEIPDSLVVPGNLDLCHTNVKSLPTGLSVSGHLDLQYSKITSLPEGLTVGGTLHADYKQLIASEKLQLEFIGSGESYITVFKAPTERAQRLHQVLWEL